MTTNSKYSLLHREELGPSMQMQVCIKQKKIWFFSVFLKSRSNFEHFKKQDDPQSLYISEITDC